jgi:hypothetical protein
MLIGSDKNSYIFFELDSKLTVGSKALLNTFIDSKDFKTRKEFLNAKDELMNFLNMKGISFTVKVGDDLNELSNSDVIAFGQFRSIFMSGDPKKM